MPVADRIQRRRLALTLLAAMLAVLVLAASGAGLARAQQTQLTLDDFDDAGLDVEIAVLVQADDTITGSLLWARGRFGDAGTLLDGGSSGVIPMLSDPAHSDDPSENGGNLIRIRRNDGGAVVINDDGTLGLRPYFGTGGAGSDLRIYFQTQDDGAAHTAVSDSGVRGDGGGGYQVFNLNSETEAVVNAISGGERYIFALARPGAPAFTAGTADREVAENQPSGTNVGAAVTATDPQGETVSYSITGSNPAGFTVTSAGQIQTGQELDHEAAPSYTVTLRAEDPGGLYSTIEVTVSVTNVNEVPAFDSDTATRSVDENSPGGTNVGDR